MPRIHELSSLLLGQARRQAGAVTRQQCLAAGTSDRVVAGLVERGAWTKLGNGLFTVGEPTWRGRVWAGWLLGGERAVIGGLAALQLRGARLDDPLPITVWTRRRHRVSSEWIFRQGMMLGTGRPPRLSVAEAMVEVAAVTEAERVIEVLGAVLDARLVEPGELREQLDQQPRLAQRALLRDLLCDEVAGVATPLEWRFVRDVLRAHGLPTGQRQVSLSRRSRSDLVFEDLKLVIELDGRLGHTGRGRIRDLARDNRHAESHYQTLRYGWHDSVGRRCVTARQVATVMRGRGWDGVLQWCSQCRADRELQRRSIQDDWR